MFQLGGFAAQGLGGFAEERSDCGQFGRLVAAGNCGHGNAEGMEDGRDLLTHLFAFDGVNDDAAAALMLLVGLGRKLMGREAASGERTE